VVENERLVRHFVHAQDAASLGTWHYDLRTEVLTWDEHAAALAGITLAEFGGTLQAFLDVVHPDDRERVLQSLTSSVLEGVPLEVSYRVVRPDSTERTLLIRGKVLRGRSGRVVRLVGACLDVTDVHRAERDLERARHAESAALMEMLQRSLLSRPPHVQDMEMVVRYAAAADGARIGGDWYDALIVPDGSLVVVVGDCVGHDQAAAVSMATMRNLLRATAYTVELPPAAVLAQLDTMVSSLGVDTMATAVLGRLERPDEPARGGVRRFVWSNAGHPPPVLVRDGRAELLGGPDSDLLLGVVDGAPRSDHEVLLPDGAVLLLYTDGLVERRGEDLDVGLERLRALVQELADDPLDELCDQLLTRMRPQTGAEDDVALLALRLRAP
jgi:PAS domain S-box-containing protein